MGGGSQQQRLDRTLQIVPRAQFGISANRYKDGCAGQPSTRDGLFSVSISLFSAWTPRQQFCKWYSAIQLRGSLSQGALPASVVKTTLHAIAQFLQVRQSSVVLPVPRQQRYFRLGFFEPHQRTKRKRTCQLVAATNPPSLSVCMAAQRFPGGPVVGGTSFGHGSRGNFHKVFEYDISALQSECAVLAQVLRDTLQDVPLDFSFQTSELRVNVPEKVLQVRTSAWSASVDGAWPLLVYITDCYTSRDAPVSWTHTAHSFHSGLQSLLRSASEHLLECRLAGGQLGSPEGEPGSPERAAGSPVSLGRDTASSSEYSPPATGGALRGGRRTYRKHRVHQC